MGCYERMKALFADSSFVLVFLLAIFCLVTRWSYGQSSRGVDFYQFWVVGQVVAQSHDVDIYANNVRRRIGREYYQLAFTNGSSARRRAAAEDRQVLVPTATPFLYTFFAAISSGSYDADYSMYLLLCLASSVLAIVGLSRMLRYSAVATMAAIVAFMTWFEPFLSDLRVGNVNQIQLGLLALFLGLESRHSWRWRHVAGGGVLGLVVTFKPNLVFVVGTLSLVWLVNRRFQKLAHAYLGIAIAAISAFAVSSIFFGSAHSWSAWLTALVALLPDSITTVSMGNYSLARLILDATGVEVSTYLALGTTMAIVAAVWVGRRSGKSDVGWNGEEDGQRALLEDMLMVGVGAAIYLVSAHLVWLHYFVLTVPLALVALRPLDPVLPAWTINKTVIRRILALAGFTLIAGDPIAALLGLNDPRYVVALASSGMVILLGLALWDVSRLNSVLSPRDATRAVSLRGVQRRQRA